MTVRHCCNWEALNKQTPRKNTTGNTNHPQQFLHFVMRGGDIKTTILLLTHLPDLQLGCTLHRGVCSTPHQDVQKGSHIHFLDLNFPWLWASLQKAVKVFLVTSNNSFIYGPLAHVFFLCFPVIADHWIKWWQTSVADISTLIKSYWNNLDEEISFQVRE